MEGDLATVLDIVIAGQRIARFTGGCDEPTFLADEQKHWAVVSQLLVIGEAVRRLSDTFRDARPGIPWQKIAGMRDRLIHGYDKINWTLVWTTAIHDVPGLAAELAGLVPPDADNDSPH